MAETKTIDADAAEELYDHLAHGKDGATWMDWTRVAVVRDGDSRWHEHRTLVASDASGALWGLTYSLGLTESQEHEFPWRESSEVELVRLYAHEVRRVEYRTEAPV